MATTDIEITEKNQYPNLVKDFTDALTSDEKGEEDSSNDSVQIGDTVSYTLTIKVPSGANQELKVTDTFTDGLSPVLDNEVVKITSTGGVDGTKWTSSDPSNGSFTITMSAADVIKNQGKTLKITYEAVVTKNAAINAQKNDAKLDYGNDYTSKTDSVDSETYNLTINKVDDNYMPLEGAEFEIYRDDETTATYLVALTNDEKIELGVTGESYIAVDSSAKFDKTATYYTRSGDGTKDNPYKYESATVESTDFNTLVANGLYLKATQVYYRVATFTVDTDGKKVYEAGATQTISMKSAASAIIYGLDGDSKYTITEITAPTGYNMLTTNETADMNDENQSKTIQNQAGSTLPSTGGIGTTLFYLIGAILIIGAGVLLVTRRRVNSEE